MCVIVYVDNQVINSRTNFFQEGRNDKGLKKEA